VKFTTAYIEDCLTSPLHLTATRLRFGMNVKGHGWAAARDGER
jgi:hypothetical protein